MAHLVKDEVVFPHAKEISNVYVDLYNPYSMSRYKRVKVLFDDSLRYMTLQEANLTIDTKNYANYVVKISDRNRLDLIAKKFYNDAKLFWVICLFNEIHDPFLVDTGTELKIPTLTALYKSGGILS